MRGLVRNAPQSCLEVNLGLPWGSDRYNLEKGRPCWARPPFDASANQPKVLLRSRSSKIDFVSFLVHVFTRVSEPRHFGEIFGGTWERPGRISAEGCPECGTVGEGWFGTLCKSVQAESLQRVVLSAEMYERVGSERSAKLPRNHSGPPLGVRRIQLIEGKALLDQTPLRCLSESAQSVPTQPELQNRLCELPGACFHEGF